MTPPTYEIDIAVIGAGPAGASVAARLAARGRRVLLVRRPFTRSRGGEVLAGQGLAILRSHGLDSKFALTHPVAIHSRRVAWGSDDLVENPSLLSPWGPGWSIDRAAFDRLLLDAAREAGVDVVDASRIAPLAGQPDDWRLGLDEQRVRARFLVDATGRSSWLARQLTARWVAHDRLVALAAIVAHQDDDPALLLESVREGWFYSVPIPGEALALAYMTDSDLLHDARQGIEETFTSALATTRHTASRLRGTDRIGRVSACRADCGRLDCAWGEGWLAVGDASNAWDPLSGAGLSRALAGAVPAADWIDSALEGSSRQGPPAERYDDFDDHLSRRAEYYGRERRWDTPFWRRRWLPVDVGITLDPDGVLFWNGQLPAPPEIPPNGSPRLGEAWARLCALCDTPRLAADIVRAFRSDPSSTGDQSAILALEELVRQGYILSEVPRGRTDTGGLPTNANNSLVHRAVTSRRL